MKKILSLLLVTAMLCCALCMSACGGDDLNFGKEYIASTKQVDLLFKLNAKQIDVGIMDSIMANYYMSTDSTYSANLQIIPNLVLASEQYGIGCRQGSGFAKKINSALIELAKDGTVNTIATKYNIASELCIDTNATVAPLTAAEQADWNYIVGQGGFIVGYTLFAPIAYEDANAPEGLAGFDIELARAVATKLGINVTFKEITWSAKEAELNAKSIDCIWNGMTITAERSANMAMSIPYLNNKQVAVIRKEDAQKYTDTKSMKKAIISAEAESAGEALVLKAKED